MGIDLHTTPYGRPAAQLLRERVVAAKQGDPLHPVTVVVPTNYVGVSARRLLAGGSLDPVTARGAGVAGLTLVTVYRLAELLGAARLAASGRRPVSTPVVAAAVRRVLADRGGMFGEVADHPFTEEALVRAYRELSEVDDDTLDLLAAQSRRAGEVVRVRRSARAVLEPAWFEEADLMAAAAAAVAAGSPVLADLGTVVVYLPQELSLPAARLLRTVADRVPVEAIAGRSGAADADADVDRALDRLGLPPPGAVAVAAVAVAPATATAIESVSDAEEEARSAVQRIVGAARRGVPLERIAVLYPHEQPYARLVTEQLHAAGIAYNARGLRPLSQRLCGRWLLDLLALPERRYERPALLGLLTGAPVLDADGQPVASGAWERVSRDAGVVRDRAQWRGKLARLAGDLRRRADSEAAEDDPRGWLIDRDRRTADVAEELAVFVSGLFDSLDVAGGLSCWRELADWARATLRRYLGGGDARGWWPAAEREAADRVEAALDRLGGLDEFAGGVDLVTFRRTLALELDDDLGKVGTFGEGVLVGLVSAGLGVNLDVVVVLGLAEGTLPTRPQEDSLLTDGERRACRGQLRLRSEHAGAEHRHVLAALAASSGERVLVFPRGDLRRSVERAPSRWLLDSAVALGGDGARTLPADADWHAPVASFDQRVRTVAFPATRQEYGLRALADVPDPDQVAAHPLVAGDPALRCGVDLLRSRGRGAFTRYDGNVGDLSAHITSPADVDHAVSTTRLERWLSCPHAYFMHHVLGVKPVENPEELLEIDPRQRGSLIHDVLERWLREQLADPPAAGEPWPDQARRRLLEIAEDACADADARGATGHRLLWRRDRQRIVSDLERFLDADDDRRRRSGLTPVAAEQPFGLPGSARGPVAVTVDEDGRAVWVRGRIDRVDRQADGALTVVDYKVGSRSAYRDISQAQPLGQDGTKLQLAVYALAAVDPGVDEPPPGVRSEYWFVSTRGEFATVGYELSGETVDALGQAVRLVTDGIAAGWFPMRPPAPAWRGDTECIYCDPDELGTADRYGDWERLRRADALREYVAHVEPGALATTGDDR